MAAPTRAPSGYVYVTVPSTHHNCVLSAVVACLRGLRPGDGMTAHDLEFAMLLRGVCGVVGLLVARGGAEALAIAQACLTHHAFLTDGAHELLKLVLPGLRVDVHAEVGGVEHRLAGDEAFRLGGAVALRLALPPVCAALVCAVGLTAAGRDHVDAVVPAEGRGSAAQPHCSEADIEALRSGLLGVLRDAVVLLARDSHALVAWRALHAAARRSAATNDGDTRVIPPLFVLEAIGEAAGSAADAVLQAACE